MSTLSKEKNSLKGVYLFNAPFFAPGNPYVSVPTLAAYLASQKVSCQAFDLGQEFWHRFLTVARIKNGVDYVETRFLELNRLEKLTFSEVAEYKKLLSLLDLINYHESYLTDIFAHGAHDNSRPLYQQKPISAFCITLATAPFFPNHMIVNPMLKLFSSFDVFCSQDIMLSTETEHFYSDGLREIITEIFSSAEAPRLVGISVMCQTQVEPGFFCARLIKEISPASHVVMGGAFVTLHLSKFDDLELFKCCDSFIVDDGEAPLLKLYRELENEPPDFSRVPAMLWQQEKMVVANPPEPPLSLATLAPPDFTVFNLERYFSPLSRIIMPFRLSRGCYWQRCAFCRTGISFCKDYEQPPVEIVFENLCRVIEETGVRRIFFSDESSRPDVLEFIANSLLERGLEIEWLAHTRFHPSLTRKRFQLFKKSGCLSLTLGLEAYNDRILALMDKGTTVKMIDQVIAANAGCLPLNMYMIVGFPTETEVEARRGYEKVKELRHQKLINAFSYSLFQIIYGSDIWRNPDLYGISQIHNSSRQNLFPEISSFSGSGMSRKQASDLYREFTATVNSSEMLLTMYNEVKVRGQITPLSYDFGQLKALVDEHLYMLYSMPYGQWLESVTSTLINKCR